MGDPKELNRYPLRNGVHLGVANAHEYAARLVAAPPGAMPTPNAKWQGNKDARGVEHMLGMNGWTKLSTRRVGEVWVRPEADVWIRHKDEGWFSFKTERPH